MLACYQLSWRKSSVARSILSWIDAFAISRDGSIVETLKSGTREVAADLGISASRLSALLKASTGSSLGKLQIAYRFWHAARAMLEVETFTDAAHAASFADAAHFSRSFRQAYGLPPSAIVIEKTAFWHCESLG